MNIDELVDMEPAEYVAIEFWPSYDALAEVWYRAQADLLAAATALRALWMYGDSETLSFLSLVAMLRGIEADESMVSEPEAEFPGILRTQAMGPSLQEGEV